MSLPSIFEYMPEQAQELCKTALQLKKLPAVLGVATATGAALKGAMDPQEEHPLRAAAIRGGLGGAAAYGAGKALQGPAMLLGARLGQKVPSTSWNRPLQGAVLGGFAGPVIGAALGNAAAEPLATRTIRALREEKTAEEVERTPREKALGATKSLGTGLLGFTTGSLAGVGGAYLLDKAYEASTGNKIPLSALHVAAPILGGAAGIAYNLYQAKQQEELRRALASKSDRPQGRIPPK